VLIGLALAYLVMKFILSLITGGRSQALYSDRGAELYQDYGRIKNVAPLACCDICNTYSSTHYPALQLDQNLLLAPASLFAK
jgi:hypothetical protein